MKILFDLDGTLTNPYQGITKCIAHALVTLGRPSPPRMSLRWCIGPPLKKSFFKLLCSDDDELAEEALAIYRERFSSVGLFENAVYDEIPETLKSLQEKDHTLYVATSKPRVFAEQIIDHFDLNQYFRGVYGSEINGTRSDKSSLISHILQRESIAATEAVMIGDREFDMIGATANNISGIGVLWGFGSKEELEASGASTCITKPEDLITSLNCSPNQQH